MDPQNLIALTGVAASMTWTPGPNNMMLAASGANFGWRRTVGHSLGVAVGFPIMLITVAVGLGKVFQTYPDLGKWMGWAGLAVIGWFAWRIATADPSGENRRARPFSFLEACGFQWINPKAWTFAIWTTASFAVDAWSAVIAATIFLGVGAMSSQAWVLFGTAMGRVLGRGLRLRIFNITMAVLLAGSAVALMMS